MARTSVRLVSIITILVPFVATVVAAFLAYGHFLSMIDLWLCLAFYLLSMFGVTAGYHRLFAHRSFKCATPVRISLGVLGSIAAQGPLMYWVATHRQHHNFSDGSGDPHSPVGFGDNWLGVLKGWWHSHVGWMSSFEPKGYFRYVPDLVRDPLSVKTSRHYLWLVAIGIIVPGLISFALNGTLHSFAQGVLWGGLVRIFIAHHTTWSINWTFANLGQS